MSSEHKQRVESFFTGLAATYDTVIPFFETFADELVTVAELEPGERVLDLACGTGRCSRAGARAVGPTGLVVSTDLTASMVTIAGGAAASEGLRNVHVTVADAEHLGVRASSFDVVTCGFGVFFFPDPDAALREVERVLDQGGRFAATTFADGVGGFEWAQEIGALLGRDASMIPSPVLTHDGLEAALTDAGFVEVASVAVEGRFVFPDVDSYLSWCWSTGTRRTLATLSPDELDRYRTLSAERLDAHAVAGGFEMRQPANVTVGRRS